MTDEEMELEEEETAYDEVYRICENDDCREPRRGPFVTDEESGMRLCRFCYRFLVLGEEPHLIED